MSCLIPLTAVACLLDPSNLVIQADTSIQVAGDFNYTSGARSFGGGHLGRISIEMSAPLPRGFELRYGLEHSSLLDTRSDRGQERVFIGITWRPFK